MASRSVQAPTLSGILFFDCVRRYQLGDKTHQPRQTDAKDGFNQTVQGIGQRMAVMIKQDDGTDISGYFGSAVQAQGRTEEHGNQNTKPDCHRTRWPKTAKHGDNHSTNRGAQDGTGQTL